MVCAYTPQVGRLEDKENFQREDGGEWNILHWTCRRRHVDEENRGGEVVRRCSIAVKERNAECQMVVEFGKRTEMEVVN